MDYRGLILSLRKMLRSRLLLQGPRNWSKPPVPNTGPVTGAKAAALMYDCPFRPFSLPAEFKELAKDFNFLDPRPVLFVTPKRIAIQRFNTDLIDVAYWPTLAVVTQECEDPVLLPLGFVRIVGMLGLECLDGVG